MSHASPIYLNDLLHLTPDELERHNYRVRLTFAWGKDEFSDPIARYRRDPDDALGHLLFPRKRIRFSVGQRVIGLVKISGTQWLLTRIVEITDVTADEDGNLVYASRDIDEFKGYFGRVILNYKNPSGAQTEVRIASSLLPEITVHELRATGFGDEDFPGYADVTVSYYRLQEIVDRAYEGWKTALSRMKGIYLIVDKSDGRAYVGKADGRTEGIWSRWSTYAKTGHGGNVELRTLSLDHIKANFQWSLLEVMDWKTQDDYVNERESWWKKALSTRGATGFNRN